MGGLEGLYLLQWEWPTSTWRQHRANAPGTVSRFAALKSFALDDTGLQQPIGSFSCTTHSRNQQLVSHLCEDNHRRYIPVPIV